MSSEQLQTLVSELQSEVKNLKDDLFQKETHIKGLESMNRELVRAVNECTCA